MYIVRRRGLVLVTCLVASLLLVANGLEICLTHKNTWLIMLAVLFCVVRSQKNVQVALQDLIEVGDQRLNHTILIIKPAVYNS